MKFKDVVIKNFFGNIRQYLAFFLCSCFSIIIFFMYATLIFNKELIEGDKSEFFIYILMLTFIGVTLFSIFFIIYAGTSFVKGRNKEFGVYLTLGLTPHELKKLVNMENAIIAVCSIAAGTIIGALFSRIFQMIVLKILDIDQFSYYLDYKSFVVTIAAFSIIFGVEFLVTGHRMSGMDINSLINDMRKNDSKQVTKKDLILGLFGPITLLISVIILVLLTSNEDLRSQPPILIAYSLFVIAGIYLCISKGGNALIEKIRGTSYYTRNMIPVSEIQHKYTQNKRIIFIVAMLSGLAMFLISSPFSLLSLCDTISENNTKNLEYVVTYNENTYDDKKVTEIINSEPVESDVRTDFLIMGLNGGNADTKEGYPVVPVSEYNKNSGTDFILNKGECINNVIIWEPGYHGINKGDKITLSIEGEQSYDFTISNAGHFDSFATRSFPNDSILIISDEDYKLISSQAADKYKGHYRVVNYENWKDTGDIVDTLSEHIGKDNCLLVATYSSYEILVELYKAFFFVTSILGALFFIAGGIVLYFRQFTELDQTKAVYESLRKIGITEKEIRKNVSIQIRTIFFVPLLFGTFLSLSLTYLITQVNGGDYMIKEFLMNAFKVVIVYFICQSVFCMLTIHKCLHEITQE